VRVQRAKRNIDARRRLVADRSDRVVNIQAARSDRLSRNWF
jgi:hypothetical protein